MTGPLRTKRAQLWEKQPEGWYVDPDWCSARLFAVEDFRGPVHDPSCGFGSVVRSARAAGLTATGGDVIQRSEFCSRVGDFRQDHTRRPEIVSNPPFHLCDPRKKPGECIVRHALRVVERKCALLLPASWVCAAGRGAWLEATPLSKVLFIGPRPSMPPGEVIAAGVKPGNGTQDFAWFIWTIGHAGPPTLGWLRRDDGVRAPDVSEVLDAFA